MILTFSFEEVQDCYRGLLGKGGQSLAPGCTAEISRLQTTNLAWITGNSKWYSVRHVFHSQTLIQTAKN